TQLLPQHAGKCHGAGLGCVVGRHSFKNLHSRDREIIHNGGTGFHHRQSCSRHQESSGEIRGYDFIPGFRIELFDWRQRMCDAGVVNQYVDSAVTHAQFSKKIVDCNWIANIANNGVELSRYRGKLLYPVIQPCAVPASDYYTVTSTAKG